MNDRGRTRLGAKRMVPRMHDGHLASTPKMVRLRTTIALCAMLTCVFAIWPSHAAQVQHLNTQTATASGAGATGTPAIASFNIPSGKNRVLFIWPTFERDHCSNADVTAGLCTNGNIISTGLGDNFPEPRIGTPPATTTNNQLTARIVGPGGTINKQNALVIGGTPSGDTRFITTTTSPSDPDPVNPPNLPVGSGFFTLASYHIVLFESEINTLLGGAASGTVTITLPDANVPSNAGDDALLIASVYQNVEQTPNGFVRNGTVFGQSVGGVDPAGNYSMVFPTAPTTGYDAGQVPDEADDGKLVMGANGTTAGFLTPAGHVALATVATTNAGGNYDTPNGGVTNEPNGMSGGAYFRNGGATPGSFYTLTSAGPATPAVYGGTTASFLLESDNADVGDAPISYGNPTHTLGGIRMGASVDADASLLNNATATGDDVNNTDDENGVNLTPLLPTGEITVVPVNIQNASGFLSVWFDWNADGDFNDAGEQMITAQAVAVGATNLNIAVPLTAIIGPTFARFRVCTNNTALDNCNTPVSTVQSGEVEDYQFTVSRRLIVRKTTLGGLGTFGFALTNTQQSTGSATTTAVNTPVTVDGNTGSAATLAFTITSPTTAVTINENSLPAGWSLTGATCVNNASVTVGSLSGNTYTLTGAEIGASVSFTCTFTNTRLPILRLQKALPSGRAVAADQFALTIAGTGGPATVTTTGGSNVANGTATLNPGALGAVYTLSEAGAAGAVLTNYTTTYACTNALSGGQTPSGSGTSFTVTGAAGDDLTCTFTNTRNPRADLRVTKTNTPGVNGEVDQAADTVVSGTSANYTIIVSNLGPDAANGAVLADPAPTGLTCTTASCTAAGGAACPVPTGAALVAALQGAGATIPTLPNGGAVTIVLTCSVN
jgi:uncharacterized repeat protein (TIGR01451 family)